VIFDIYIDVYVFYEGTVYEQLVHPKNFELYFRGLLILVFLVFGLITSRTILLLKQNQAQQRDTILRLENASNEIKVLKGMIPICASCKKIRDDDGFWHRLETYIDNNSEAQFSHGICPECKETLYGKKENESG